MPTFPPRLRRILLIAAIPIFIFLSLIAIRSHKLPNNIDAKLPARLTGEPAGYNPKQKPKPVYLPPAEKPPPITDNFPLAARAKSSSDLPPIPPWNKPPRTRPKHATPLFIGFTRNWRLLQQTVVSYITAGWPPGDIYVIENTGVMNSNKDNLLTLQNPFYLDYHRLTKVFGVNVITTPTLLTFAQLQNFYIWTAVQKGWDYYWWAHMDTVVISDEEYEAKDGGFKSVYSRAVEAMEETMQEGWGELATLWYHYDRLALVRTKAFMDVGGWDTLIPFYVTDCDMHERLWMKGFKLESAEAGKIWDVANTLDDLELLYRRGDLLKAKDDKKEEAKQKETRNEVKVERNSPAYKDLLERLDILQHEKSANKEGRNTWQASQKGGQGEPFYRDSDGFERGIQLWMNFGRDVFAEKWGRGDCDIRDAGLKLDDQWRVVKDWENKNVQRDYWRMRGKEARKKEKDDREGKTERSV